MNMIFRTLYAFSTIVREANEIMNMLLRVGITGQTGFIGSHLYNYLGIFPDIARVPFARDFFTDEAALRKFVRECDVIIHLAGISRCDDEPMMYAVNVKLTRQLIAAMTAEKVNPRVIFGTTVYEQRDGGYHSSKRESRKLLEGWADKSGAAFNAFMMPNVFGPFGRPDYNSMVATFCYRTAKHKNVHITGDAPVQLIFINNLCQDFVSAITGEIDQKQYYPQPTGEKTANQVLELLQSFKKEYAESFVFPDLTDKFNAALFKTFQSYLVHNELFPVKIKQNNSGLAGIWKLVQQGNCAAMVTLNTLVPGARTGRFFHTAKLERIAVIKGSAFIQICRTGTAETCNYKISGENPTFVDIPIWHTFSIVNTGGEELLMICWQGGLDNPRDADMYSEKD
jgi:UDP-2-acetamido-2,6-beta-L-arabino-hexul-4-ose reductase